MSLREAPAAARGRENRYSYLLVSLLVMILGGILLEGSVLGTRSMGALFAAVLILALYVIRRRRRVFLIGLALIIPVIAVQAFNLFTESRSIAIFRLSLTLLFLGYTSAVMLADVLQGRRMSADRIAGAICIYLLIGVFWSNLYSIIGIVSPEAFRVPAEDAARMAADSAGAVVMPTMIYYSFVTLTTLGYGDIVPLSPAARTFAWLEAVVGQMYIAILIAGLVSQHISRSGTGGTGDEEQTR